MEQRICTRCLLREMIASDASKQAELEMIKKYRDAIKQSDRVSEEEYEKLEKQYLLQCKKEAFGYACLTNQKCYYRENYPQMVVENAGIDDLILLMSGGK